MLKINFIVVLCTLSTLTVVGQESDFVPMSRKEQAEIEKRDYGLLAVSGGFCFPLGSFSFKEVQDPAAGFAKTGFTINFLDAAHFLSKNVGLGVRWNRHQFGYAHEAISEWFQVRVPNTTFFVRSDDPWVVHTALFNLVGVLPGKVADLDLRFGLGYSHIKRPEILLEGFEASTGYFKYSWLQQATTTSAMVVGFGSNVRFHLDEDIDVIMTWDVQRSTARMEVVNVYGVVNEQVETVVQPISIMAIGLGVGIRL
ncbi:MAG: hypothetical protein RLP15_12430 [Cryomorphaceae bacterium]